MIENHPILIVVLAVIITSCISSIVTSIIENDSKIKIEKIKSEAAVLLSKEENKRLEIMQSFVK